jgi:hypothetical protein
LAFGLFSDFVDLALGPPAWGWSPYWNPYYYNPFYSWNAVGAYGAYAPGYSGEYYGQPGPNDYSPADSDQYFDQGFDQGYSGGASSNEIFPSPFNAEPRSEPASPLNRNDIFSSPLAPPTGTSSPALAPAPPRPVPELQTAARVQLTT